MQCSTYDDDGDDDDMLVTFTWTHNEAKRIHVSKRRFQTFFGGGRVTRWRREARQESTGSNIKSNGEKNTPDFYDNRNIVICIIKTVKFEWDK